MTIQTCKIMHPDFINAVGILKLGKSSQNHEHWDIYGP